MDTGAWRNWYTRSIQNRVAYGLVGSSPTAPTHHLSTGSRWVDIRTLALPDGAIDLAKREVVRGPFTARLSSTETRLLGYLAARPNEEVSREDLLVDVWGYAPNAATRTIDTTIRRLRKKIETDPSSPRVILTIQGRGYRLAQQEEETSDEVQAALVSSSYFGRQAEVLRIRQALVSPGAIVTLLGPGGIGKSRAVEEAIEPLLGAHSIVHINLADLMPDDGLSRRVSHAMGLSAGTDDPVGQVRSVLAMNPVIIVLDAFEHCVERAWEVAQWMTDDTQGCVVLTSRIGVEIEGVVSIRLAPLGQDDAIAMLLERARRVRPDFGEHTDSSVLAQLVHHLDRIPLAIELASALARLCDVREMLRRLQDQSSLIHGQANGMSAVFQWSWSQLKAVEAQALAESTVFRGGFDRLAASAVLNIAEDTIDEVLASLVNQSLLRRMASEDGPRFVLYDTVRQHARHHLSEEQGASVRARHVAHYLAWGANLVGDVVCGHPEAARRMLRERDNLLRVAGAGAAEARLAATIYITQAESVRGLGQAELDLLRTRLTDFQASGGAQGSVLYQQAQLLIGRIFHVLGRRSDADTVFQRLAEAPGTDERISLRARASAAGLRILRGELDSAESECFSILKEATARGLSDCEYAALESLCLLNRARSDHTRIVEHAQQLFDLTEARGHTLWQPLAHMYLGTSAVWENDLDAIREHFSAAAEQDEMMGATSRIALARAFGGNSLAQLALDESTLDEANRWLDDAETLERSIGRRVATNVVLMGRSRVAAARGDYEAARSTLQKSLREARAREHGPWIGVMSLLLAGVSVLEGDLFDAADVLDEAITRCKVPTMAIPLAAFRSAVHAATGDLMTADAAWGQWERDGHSASMSVQLTLYRGQLEVARGDEAAARQCAEAIDAGGDVPFLAVRIAHKWLMRSVEDRFV